MSPGSQTVSSDKLGHEEAVNKGARRKWGSVGKQKYDTRAATRIDRTKLNNVHYRDAARHHSSLSSGRHHPMLPLVHPLAPAILKRNDLTLSPQIPDHRIPVWTGAC